jgi:heme/copper-type cytochrome/quinol oxidase subunit 3
MCSEYLHIFTTIAGVAMLFFVVTGLHGSHVGIGVLGLLLFFLLRCEEGNLFSPCDLSHLAGVMGLLLYWHFVDAVWVLVVGAIYWSCCSS